MNAIKLYWLWYFFWLFIFAADAANNALLDRSTQISWLWVHFFFWLTRDIPAIITGIYILVKFFKEYGKFDLFSVLITVEFAVFAAASYYLVFTRVYSWIFQHRHLFFGGDKPTWWPF